MICFSKTKVTKRKAVIANPYLPLLKLQKPSWNVNSDLLVEASSLIDLSLAVKVATTNTLLPVSANHTSKIDRFIDPKTAQLLIIKK